MMVVDSGKSIRKEETKGSHSYVKTIFFNKWFFSLYMYVTRFSLKESEVVN